jgi:hypothetical protein
MVTDFSAVVYEKLRENVELREGRQLSRVQIRPWLSTTYGFSVRDGRRVRDAAMADLKRRGKIRRVNTRGPWVEILG